MPITPTFPGVYVQEIPSGVRAIAGVSTSVAMFVARARKGPLDQAIRIFSYTDFERSYSSDTTVSTLADHVRLFFLNGGTDCYVMRIANGATYASVTLNTEAGAASLELTATQAGLIGETVRAVVSYGGSSPETTFTLDLFREEVDPSGRVSILDGETFKNLSMNPDSLNYAPEIINANSKLVTAAADAGLAAAGNAFSMSGVPVVYATDDGADFLAQWATRLGNAPGLTTNRFNISVDGNPSVMVDLSGIDVAGLNDATIGDATGDLADAIQTRINDTLVARGIVGASVTVTFELSTEADGTRIAPRLAAVGSDSSVLMITSDLAGAGSSVVIQSASSNDLAASLALGGGQGGLEVTPYSEHRPAPNGITLRASSPQTLRRIAEVLQNGITQISLPGFDALGAPAVVNIPANLVTSAATDALWSGTGGLLGGLTALAEAINLYRNNNPYSFYWSAVVNGYRLTLTSPQGSANTIGTLATSPTNINANNDITLNTRSYSVGAGGLGAFQTPAGAAASDGNPPQLSDYTNAFTNIDKQVDIFNLMVIPEDADPLAAAPLSQVYGVASVFCQQRRAFLIMDAPASWQTPQQATTGIVAARVGLVKDHSAIYFPRVVIPDGRKKKTIGASGAVAGVYARIDGTRGVWKAPAGVEADIRGIIGLDKQLSDQEHGSLNPLGINALRAFPNGLVVYGARTNDGADDFASEYKYVPIRRLALFIEESLYRGLKWVVFEPNDEPLYGQIRLNVGTFMQDLYRRGAFQGSKPSDAYFVKCDRETTTESDRNLGIVNIIVGFAPLKPAEFVLLYLQQMAGQAQV